MTRVISKNALPIALAGAALMLSGCGGGGGGGPTPAPAAPTPAPPTAAPTPGPTAPPTPLPTMDYSLYSCESTYETAVTPKQMANKGMCIDDTTFWHCADQMTGLWPNTPPATSTDDFDKKKIKSMRLFASWKPAWGGDTEREAAWDKLVTWVKTNNAKILLGTEVTCQIDVDDQMWKWNMALADKLGKEHILGFAVGNEMDIYWSKGNMPGWTRQCVDDLWNHRFWDTLQARVADIDAKGWTEMPITIIWAMSVLGGEPWLEDPAQAKVNTLVNQAYKKWPTRWVWSFNVYSIWDKNLWPTSASDCAAKTAASVGIDYTKNILKACRKRIKETTGSDTAPIWIGENGWSSPLPQGCGWGGNGFEYCKGFGSVDTLKTAYEAFLSWDLDIGEGLHGVDHAFYFTMRDSVNGQSREGFGLIANCGDKTCKIQGSPSPGTQSTCKKLGCGQHDDTCWCKDSCKSHNNCCPDYDSQCGHQTESAQQTCATLGCGNHDTCWCNAECVQHNSCCADYQATCNGRATNFMAMNSSRLEFV